MTEMITPGTTIVEEFSQFYGERHTSKPITIAEYFEEVKGNPKMFQSSHAAMVEAFGKPKMLNTRDDPRLSRIYENRILKVFEPFEKEFFGMYDVIQNMYGFFLSGSQGLDAAHKILYLLGPVGGGKSSLVEKLKQLAELVPMWVLACAEKEKGDILVTSPVFESPLGLFAEAGMRTRVSEKYNMPLRAFPRIMSPWARKRLEEDRGDISRFRVVELLPSIVDQMGIGVAPPGDDTNQDTSTLVGKTDIRKLEQFAQNGPDAYSFSGALCVGQRMMEFVEMFKAPIKTLNPLLPATMENYFSGTESIGAIPYQGIILAHSNESEWDKFRAKKENEAFIDRIVKVKVPYVLSVTEEVQIYDKLINNSALRGAPCAPGTKEALATFSVLTRIAKPEGDSSYEAKVRVYNGEDLSHTNLKAKQLIEYRNAAGVNEGMTGDSTRLAYEILAKTYNFDPTEIAADPVHLLNVLPHEIKQRNLGEGIEKAYLVTFVGILYAQLKKTIEHAIRDSYLEAGDALGQATFDRYITLANHWIDTQDYKDPDTGHIWNRTAINAKLEEIEKPAGISNPKDFRNEVSRYAIKHKAEHGKFPDWREYGKMREVIESKMFKNIDDMLPVITFSVKTDQKLEAEHQGFVERMMGRGYTRKQVRRMVEWFEQEKNK